ncbi:uncharacterized protein N7515_005186 [Penicillium bovifimosum]|uniref:Uncharacterized protein n=1 Tax=Penicillium bovifimosum TaxID=126998 RepID=A0A9W9GSA3_9EURO|nr:uncharacterized protein N7515_005186 [Penicillium bovifimosum]KAJ5129147.1 hypothetical protein N7515_005186 [Penicillium bovifimosum]
MPRPLMLVALQVIDSFAPANDRMTGVRAELFVLQCHSGIALYLELRVGKRYILDTPLLPTRHEDCKARADGNFLVA